MLIAPAMRSGAAKSDASRHAYVPLVRLTHGLINRMVMASDAILLVIFGLLARQSLAGYPCPLTVAQALVTCLVAAAGLTAVMRWIGAYRVERLSSVRKPFTDLLRSYVPAAIFATGPIWAFTPQTVRHPAWLLCWSTAVFGGLVLGRQFVRLTVRYVERRALLRRRVVIIGASAPGEALLRQMAAPAMAQDYEIVGLFADSTDEHHPTMLAGHPVSGTVADLVVYAQHNPVDLIVLALPWERSRAIFGLIEQVQWIAADVAVPFEKSGYHPPFAQMIDVAGAPALQVMNRPFKGTQGLAKAAEDYLVAALGLLIASPIMLMAALAIRLDSPGPVMFRQTRVGFNGRTFLIYKFRTMTVDPNDDGSLGTDKSDPRITRVGAFLRKTSIDEIPQLLNVLRGEMSVVGPRPHVPRMLVGNERYTETVRRYAARHRIKPGITGWAQINGMRGGIHSVAKAERGVELDLHYIANWSLRLDVKIMARTLMIGMAGRDVF